jgi:5S rRNA maturation endonuclease (ribonuclease M5)
MMEPEAPALDFGELAGRAVAAVKPEDLDRLAVAFGVSSTSLRRLRIGWLPDRRGWGFPMRSAAGAVVGVRLRFPNGKKLSVRGGREGLFLPEDLRPGGRLLITEGPTDCAALLDLGFSAVGRPSCRGGVKHLIDLTRRLAPEDVVIVADGDAPGRKGADDLARRLAAYVPTLRIVTPPPGIKDARAWKRAGATAADVLAAIEAAAPRRLEVRSKRKGRTKCPRKATG